MKVGGYDFIQGACPETSEISLPYLSFTILCSEFHFPHLTFNKVHGVLTSQ